ncbi:MAG TPA: Rieske 2Fe-2S domain-containing protein [Mucilaginibacter sp.]|jgi:nitrite reductase/ring-hydroxylating ferredoxin subunit|nr:Rieske 2Fe-2S domain-containing protein [Mucilaginibacter sp.]
MEWYQVPDLKITGQPFIKRVKAGGKTLCLVGYENEVYALGARCPHAGGDLTQGWCEEGKLICPVHRYSFDLKTGKGSPGQNDYIDSYPVEIRDGLVYIGITSLWERIKQAFK